jgi:hypothetical protein
MKLPIGLLISAVVLFGAGILARSEEVIVAALLAAGVSPFTYIAALRARLTRLEARQGLEGQLAEMDRRLSLTEGELQSANTELERLRTEREFDRQLLGKQVTRREQ